MACTYGSEYIHATMHDFKSNIAKYTRLLERRKFKGVIVKRYHHPVGLFVLMPQEEDRAEPQTISDVMRRDILD